MTLPLVLDEVRVLELLDRIDIQASLRRMFAGLAAGTATQPPQLLVPFPQDVGDFISYLGVLADAQVFGVKLSPYIVRPGRPLITAWSLLMSMVSGQPLLLCDSARLTAERTAATTALAVDLLAPADAAMLVVIGTGAIGQAHLRHATGLRRWRDIRVHSRHLAQASAESRAALRALDPRVSLHGDLAPTLRGADVVLLCTSSGVPVIDPQTLDKPALITSVSTNAVHAHEVPPRSLAAMDVYCDYRATTPGSAGEMLIATQAHGWSADAIRGDLPGLVTGATQRPDPLRHTFFRSIGLGLEDVVIAHDLYRLLGDEKSAGAQQTIV